MSEESQKVLNNGAIRSAMTVLPELQAGRAVTELSGAIHDAIAAVREHGKSAVVALQLTIAPASDQRLADPAITITPKVLTKLPTETPDATLFFVDGDGNPTRQLERRRQDDLGFSVATPQSNQQAS